ncbi:MAG: transposase [Proteobacteria bacterium]|nr:transposase [Pseudomonadota bacterium]
MRGLLAFMNCLEIPLDITSVTIESVEFTIILRHLSILGKPTYLKFKPRRYWCSHCKAQPTTTQRLPWYELRSPHTRAYENHILLSLVNSTVMDVSIKEGIGYEAVMGIIKRHVSPEVDWSEFEDLEIIGVDEIALKKGHRDFVTIISVLLRNGKKRVIGGCWKTARRRQCENFLGAFPSTYVKRCGYFAWIYTKVLSMRLKNFLGGRYES